MDLDTLELIPSPGTARRGLGGFRVTLFNRDRPPANVARWLEARLRQAGGDVARTRLQPGISPAGRWRLGPGAVRLCTSRDGVWHAFSCGGTVDTSVAAGSLCCELRSEAPVLRLDPDHETVDDRIADEIALRLAAARSATRDAVALERRLVALHPLVLYAALVTDIRVTYARSRDLLRIAHESDAALAGEQCWLREAGLPHEGAATWPEIVAG